MIQLRGRTFLGFDAGNSRVIDKVPGTTTGDLLELHISVSLGPANISAVPAGFTLVSNGEISGTNSISIYQKTATGSEPSTYTITFTGTPASTIDLVGWYSDTGKTLVIDASANATRASVTSVVYPAVSPTHPNTMLNLFGTSDTGTDSTPPGGTTESYDHGSGIRNVLMYEAIAATGSTGTRTATAGISSSWKVVSLTIAEQIPPVGPSALVATTTGTSSIGLAWVDNDSTETGFQIERSADGSTGWTLINSPAANATSYSNTGLTESTPYFYRIRSVNVDGNSAWSNTATATTDLIAPTGLSATAASASQINLAWMDGSAFEDGYEIERSVNGTTGWFLIHTTAANAVSYSVTGLTSANTIHYFRVRAFHGAQYSAYTSVANAYTEPAAPTALVASGTLSSKIVLTWSDSNTGEDGFKVERSATGAGSWSQIGTSVATTFDDTGLSPSATWYYRVRAYRSTQNSAYSGTAYTTTPAALTTPTSLAASVISPTSARISWSSSDLAVTGYKVERKTGGGAYAEVAGVSASPYLDLGLTSELTYTWRVRSYRSGSVEYSSYSSEVTLVMPTEVESVKPQHLYLHQPTTVYSGQINMATVTYPIDSITVDNTTGTYGNIKVGQTITFGSAPGLSDQGRNRVRSVPGGAVIGIGRSPRGRHLGEANIADNSYFYISDEYRVFSKVPAFTAAGVIFKDVDVAIGTNTSLPPPVSNCGPGFAGTIDSITGKITVQFTSTSFTTAPAATITTYAWNIADGTLTAGSLSGSTVTAQFPAGFRYVHLTITDSNGKTHISHCPVYARDPLADTSVRNFQITQHSIKQTGQNISFNIREDISAPPDGMLAMLWEGEAATPADRSFMVFIGWHHTDPATIAAGRTGTLKDVTLDCVDVAGMLQVLAGYSLKIEHAASPADWLHFANPTIDLYCHHILQWHTTALDLADFQLSGTGSTYTVSILQSDEMSTHEQVQQLCQKMIPSWLFTCNRRGQLAITVDPLTQATADRTATVQCTLYAFDYSDIHYTRQHFPTVSKIRKWALLTGLGTATSISSLAPGLSPGQGVEVRELTEGLVVSQSILNDATGRLYARLNGTLGKLAITLAYGDDRDIELANLTWINVDLPASIAAQRGMTLLPARGLVHEMNIRYDYQRAGTVKTIDLTWEVETTGFPGATEVHATTAPIDIGGGITAPTTPEIVPPPSIASGVNKVAMIDNNGGIITTSNFQSSPPTWTAYTGIVSDTSVDNFSSHPFHSMIVDPFSPLYRGLGTTVNAYAVNQTRIWKITDIFGVAGSPTITSIHTFDTDDHPYVRNRTIMASFGRYFTAEADNPWLMVASYYRNVFDDAPNGTYVVYSKDAGATWSLEKIVTAEHDVDTNISKIHYNGLQLSPRVPGKAYTVAYHLDGADPYSTSPRGYVSTDWGETWALSGVPDISPIGNMGGLIHVPYPTNTAEDIVYYGAKDNLYWKLYKYDIGGHDLSPSVSGITYGPLRYPFGVRTFDSDRKYVALAGRGNGVDDLYLSSSNNKAAVFVSSDYGATWTTIVSPISGNVNDVFPDSVAFSGDDRNVIYIWGNEFYVAQSVDFGATVEDKYGNIGGLAYSGYEEVLLFVGGDR